MRLDSYKCVLCLALVLASLSAPIHAQQPAFNNLLAMDSPVLYREFFRFHSSFQEWLGTRQAGKPANEVAELNRGAAATFGLRENEYQQMSAVTTSVARELRDIDQELIAHANARARYEQHPVPAVVEKLEKRRQDVVARGMARLQQALPAEALASVKAYINGPYRSGIKVH